MAAFVIFRNLVRTIEKKTFGIDLSLLTEGPGDNGFGDDLINPCLL